MYIELELLMLFRLEFYKFIMLKNNSFLIIFIILSASFSSHAESRKLTEITQTQKDRFNQSIESLEGPMYSSDNAEKVAEALINKGQFRLATFQIQALGKIYRDIDEDFNKLRKDFKKLEGKIGEYKKWNDILISSEHKDRPKEVLDRYKENRKNTLKNLEIFLTRAGWIRNANSESKLQEWKDWVNNYNWGHYNIDRRYVLEQTISQLKIVQNTNWKILAF